MLSALTFKRDDFASELHECECYSLYNDFDEDYQYYNRAKIMIKIDRKNKTVELLHNNLPFDLFHKCNELLYEEALSLDIIGYSLI